MIALSTLKRSTLSWVIVVHKSYGLNNNSLTLDWFLITFQLNMITLVQYIYPRIQFNILGLNTLTLGIIFCVIMCKRVMLYWNSLIQQTNLQIYSLSLFVKKEWTSSKEKLACWMVTLYELWLFVAFVFDCLTLEWYILLILLQKLIKSHLCLKRLNPSSIFQFWNFFMIITLMSLTVKIWFLTKPNHVHN